MRITELILDGFKSYPHRTSISGWDGSFNAVTGLCVSFVVELSRSSS